MKRVYLFVIVACLTTARSHSPTLRNEAASVPAFRTRSSITTIRCRTTFVKARERSWPLTGRVFRTRRSPPYC